MEDPEEIDFFCSIGWGPDAYVAQQLGDVWLHPEMKEVAVRQVPVEQQTDGTSCGYRVIAMATDLGEGKSNEQVSRTSYDVASLGQALIDMFESGNVPVQFPVLTRDRHNATGERLRTRAIAPSLVVVERPLCPAYVPTVSLGLELGRSRPPY
jgi:hypothetical protein